MGNNGYLRKQETWSAQQMLFLEAAVTDKKDPVGNCL